MGINGSLQWLGMIKISKCHYVVTRSENCFFNMNMYRQIVAKA